MSSQSQSPSALLSQIKAVYDKQQDPASASSLLTRAKVQLAQSGLLVPVTGKGKQNSRELEAARDILSYGALLAVRSKDVSQFDRYLAQVKPFWSANLGWALLGHQELRRC